MPQPSWERTGIPECNFIIARWSRVYNTEDKGFVYSPLFFVRGGYIYNRTLSNAGYYGIYWSSTVQSDTNARRLLFNSGGSATQNDSYRYDGFSLRWLA